ncbi:MAG TPA: hypothetical protein DCP28_37310, partial [Cytophagales bacterium]|nr:hypothetical protein [Cytophagales bacterium]
RVAEGYLWREGAWERNGFIDLTLGRRIFTTGRELYRWGQAMTDDRLLPDSLRQQLYANHLQGVNSPIAYGYGWVPYTPGGAYPMGNLELDRPYIIHGGNTEGYRSLLAVVNEGEYTVALLFNVGDRTDETELAKKILHLLIPQEHD